MKEILSKQNETIKDLKKQKLKNRFLLFLDNPKTIKEAISYGLICQFLLIDKTKQSTFENFDAENIILTNESIIREFTDVKNPQGIIGVFNFERTSLSLPHGNFLVLDELQDAGNIGTLLRSALGANFKDVYLLNCTSLTNDKIVRSSMASIFNLNVFETTREDFIAFVNKNKLNLVYADMQGENVFEAKITQPIGIVIGNEGNGVSSAMKEIANKALSIPMKNNLESLNAGVAGSILMFQIENMKKGENL